MMSFSDNITDIKKRKPTKKSPDATVEQEHLDLSSSQIALVLSDTQILKVKGERSSFATAFKEQWSSEVINFYEKIIERAIDIRARVRTNRGISPPPILSDLHSILKKDLANQLYEYAMLSPYKYDEMDVHNAKVAFISLLVGQEMGYDTKMLLKLGLAALLGNVGLYKIPERILEKGGRLDDKEMAMIRQHPKISYEILAQMGEKYQWLAEVALQVHERSDGSGYPYGLKGREIYELSATIGLIDVYVAMVSDRPYRDKFVLTDAIEYVVEEGKKKFPAKIRKAFLDRITLFPVNTHIRLNNNAIGRVVSTDKDQPLRPSIELLYDCAGNKVERRELIQLWEKPSLYIAESIHEKDHL